ncbi:MAG: hypothetical protein ACK55I_01025, partial [bacterium]
SLLGCFDPSPGASQEFRFFCKTYRQSHTSFHEVIVIDIKQIQSLLIATAEQHTSFTENRQLHSARKSDDVQVTPFVTSMKRIHGGDRPTARQQFY